MEGGKHRLRRDLTPAMLNRFQPGGCVLERPPNLEQPDAMKALLCTRYGTPDELEFADIAEPDAGAGEAVVRIERPR